MEAPRFSLGSADKFWPDQTVRLQNRSPWHREPQYSLVVILHIDKVI